MYEKDKKYACCAHICIMVFDHGYQEEYRYYQGARVHILTGNSMQLSFHFSSFFCQKQWLVGVGWVGWLGACEFLYFITSFTTTAMRYKVKVTPNKSYSTLVNVACTMSVFCTKKHVNAFLLSLVPLFFSPGSSYYHINFLREE